jgi:hypothetical protein
MPGLARVVCFKSDARPVARRTFPEEIRSREFTGLRVRPSSCRFGKKVFQILEDGVAGGMPPDFVDIGKFLDLADHLFEAVVLANAQPDAAERRVWQRQAEDAVNVEGAPGEEAHDMGHDARVIRDGKLEDGIHINRGSVAGGVHA